MSALWFICIKIRNLGFVDVGWAFSFSVGGLVILCTSPIKMDQLILTLIYCFWSLRLSLHLFKRVFSHHPLEDRRYIQLRENWAHRLKLFSFIFFQAQAFLVALLSGPLIFNQIYSSGTMDGIKWAGTLVWLCGIWGETISDLQLKKFVSAPNNKGQVCNSGLWRFSRHPNYFFEWLTWVGYFIFLSSTPWGWTMVYCPIMMLFFLLRVTGIPATEAQSLKSKGVLYKAYQDSTSAFVPWFPKKR